MFKPHNNTLSITSELLGLTDVKVTDVSMNIQKNEVVITVESTVKSVPCRVCKQPTKGHGYGRKLRLRHLPLLGQDTFIEITPRRGICRDCDNTPTTTEVMDWYKVNSKFTKAFEHRMLFELVNSTVADVSRKEGVDYHMVEALVDHYIDTEIDYSTIDELGVLGLDEVSLKKGYRDFVTLISYRINNKVNILGVIEGREKADVLQFLSKIPRHLQKTISAICCDLYDGYMNACSEIFKDIPIVADRFHVRRLYRKSLITLRKSELKRLKKKLTEEEYGELKPAIAILRKQKDYFSDSEKVVIEKLFTLSPKLKLAYQFSRELTGIFDSHITPELAKDKMVEWIDRVTKSKLKCFNKFTKTLSKYQVQICNYFIQRNNSGFVEGFNNKVKVLKRRCYGLSSATKLFQRLILDTLGLEMFGTRATAF